MDELKKKIEALLFASGRLMSFEEIKKLCRVNDDDALKRALQDLKIDYDNRDSSLTLLNEDDLWKIATKDSYLSIVKKVVTETELSKTLMETLAVIAWKYPIKQSDLIAIRTNKAYDHLRELEEIGYISRQKFGRSKLIKLTDKFFSYFDLPQDRIKEKFADFNQMADSISNKEKEIENTKEEHKKLAEFTKKEHKEHEKQQAEELEKVEKEIDLIDEYNQKIKLETFTDERTGKTDEQKENHVKVYGLNEEETQISKNKVAKQKSDDSESDEQVEDLDEARELLKEESESESDDREDSEENENVGVDDETKDDTSKADDNDLESTDEAKKDNESQDDEGSDDTSNVDDNNSESNDEDNKNNEDSENKDDTKSEDKSEKIDPNKNISAYAREILKEELSEEDLRTQKEKEFEKKTDEIVDKIIHPDDENI